MIGWRQGQGARSSSFGSLLLAIPDQQGTLHYAGRVGTGFRQEQLTQIRARLQKLTRKTPPAKDVPAADQRDAHWVSPKLVGEVQYSETTRDGACAIRCGAAGARTRTRSRSAANNRPLIAGWDLAGRPWD